MLALKNDFPIFSKYPGLVYLDNAATTQKPRCVIDSISNYYATSNANPLRGLYDLSNKATALYEGARHTVASFIGALDCEIIFTRNTTEGLNLVANITKLLPGDEVALSVACHHSAMLPWQKICKDTGSRLVWLEINEDGSMDPAEYSKITKNTKVVAFPIVSNMLGRLDAEKLIDVAHKAGAIVIADGAQSVPHEKTDVKKLDADFLAFSGHKMLGPMACGVLYGKRELLEAAPPFLRGGEMIEYVTRESATWAELPHKFEAGTVDAAGAVGLAAAIGYIKNIGFDNINNHEESLTQLMLDGLKSIPHVRVIGRPLANGRAGIVTFVIDDVHPHDIASILDCDGIAIRAGHHCAQVLHKTLALSATARASCYLYNTKEDIEIFIDKVSKVRSCMGL